MLGHMGRDDALADHLDGHKLHVIGNWENPGLAEKAHASGGTHNGFGDITDVETIAELVQHLKPDMFLTNIDAALEAGVVDAIRHRVQSNKMPELYLPCPDRAASRVEWDKFYLRELIDAIDPRMNPANFMIESLVQIEPAVAFFRESGVETVIKPRGLTGGKGVKVQGKHYDTYTEASAYARQVLETHNQTGVEIQEKLDGNEFTLQIFTDGKTMIQPPATYDYPYREDGDVGPGTGGMGTFSMKDGLMPFITPTDYSQAIALMDKLLKEMKVRGDEYKGVLYPTFFKTADGLKIVEVNARGGDPELINILDLVEDDVDIAEVLKQVSVGELAIDCIRFKKLASAMVYLVSPEYGYESNGRRYEFYMEPEVATDTGCKIRFAATQMLSPRHYCTAGSSRSVGVSSLAETPWQARQNIHDFIQAGFTGHMPLDYRSDVADKSYIQSLK